VCVYIYIYTYTITFLQSVGMLIIHLDMEFQISVWWDVQTGCSVACKEFLSLAFVTLVTHVIM